MAFRYQEIQNIAFFVSLSIFVNLLQASRSAENIPSGCGFPAVFNFGDSNSDTGGLSAAFGQAGFPDGETFFHRPAGRYCDGRLIIDFLGDVIYIHSPFA